jgi:hypothetical protein
LDDPLKFHPPFSILCLAAILVGSRDHQTQFWKGAIQESFQQSLVEIGSVVIKPNLAGMVPFKIVSDSPVLHSRWLPLLKIEISSNGQNCSYFKPECAQICQTQFWKGAIQESFQQSLVEIGSVVSEEKIFF